MDFFLPYNHFSVFKIGLKLFKVGSFREYFCCIALVLLVYLVKLCAAG